MMTPARRRSDSSWNWLRQIKEFWVIIVFIIGAIIAFLNTQRAVIDLQKQMLTVTQRQDSGAKRAEARDYMTCRMFEIVVTLKKDSALVTLPKRCEDVFQNVGYR